jgi:hypothetical protein
LPILAELKVSNFDLALQTFFPTIILLIFFYRVFISCVVVKWWAIFVVDVMFIATISYDWLFALLASPVPLPIPRNKRNENKPK